MSEQSLKYKTIKGIGWSAVDNIMQYIVTFIVGIILARLLTPDDYGLIGIIGIFTSVCTALINGGFQTALIRSKDVTDDDYNTAFIVNITLSILLYFVIFFAAPFIAEYFKREELTNLTRVSSLSMIIGAFSIVQQTKLTKNIDFKTQTKISLISSVISGIIGITMAFFNYGVWSLVAQSIISQSFRTSLMIFYNKWLPSYHFCRDSFNKLFGYGWKMMISNILNDVWNQLYQFVIGKYYSPATLGQYTRANIFSSLFSSNLTSVIQRVTYPVLSNIQDEKERMVSAYRQIIKLTMFITFACMFMLGSVSEPLIYCLIGPKWKESSIYLPILCLIGSFYPLHAINLNMLQVLGRSDIFLFLEVLKKIVALIPIFIGAFIGIMPMLYVSIFTSIIGYFLNSYYTGKKLGYSSIMQLNDISKSFCIALLVSIPVYFFKYMLLSSFLVLPIQLVVYVFLFVVVCRISKSSEYRQVISLLQPIIQKIKR